MKVGYARVSSDEQNLEVQRDALKAAGCERVYEEKLSGSNAEDRPELQAVLGFVRDGDIIIVTKLDRMARNTLDMLTIINDLGSRGVKFTSIAEPWANTDSPAAELILTLMAGVATFERARLKERQREGIDRVKRNGETKEDGTLKYAGRKPTVPRDKVIEMDAQGIGPSRIARELNIGESSVFRVLREAKGVDGVTA